MNNRKGKSSSVSRSTPASARSPNQIMYSDVVALRKLPQHRGRSARALEPPASNFNEANPSRSSLFRRVTDVTGENASKQNIASPNQIRKRRKINPPPPSTKQPLLPRPHASLPRKQSSTENFNKSIGIPKDPYVNDVISDPRTSLKSPRGASSNNVIRNVQLPIAASRGKPCPGDTNAAGLAWRITKKIQQAPPSSAKGEEKLKVKTNIVLGQSQSPLNTKPYPPSGSPSTRILNGSSCNNVNLKKYSIPKPSNLAQISPKIRTCSEFKFESEKICTDIDNIQHVPHKNLCAKTITDIMTKKMSSQRTKNSVEISINRSDNGFPQECLSNNLTSTASLHTKSQSVSQQEYFEMSHSSNIVSTPDSFFSDSKVIADHISSQGPHIWHSSFEEKQTNIAIDESPGDNMTNMGHSYLKQSRCVVNPKDSSDLKSVMNTTSEGLNCIPLPTPLTETISPLVAQIPVVLSMDKMQHKPIPCGTDSAKQIKWMIVRCSNLKDLMEIRNEVCLRKIAFAAGIDVNWKQTEGNKAKEILMKRVREWIIEDMDRCFQQSIDNFAESQEKRMAIAKLRNIINTIKISKCKNNEFNDRDEIFDSKPPQVTSSSDIRSNIQPMHIESSSTTPSHLNSNPDVMHFLVENTDHEGSENKEQERSLFLRNNTRQSTSEIDFQPAIVESGFEINCTKQDVKDYKIAGLVKTNYIKKNSVVTRTNASAQNLCENGMSIDQNQIHPTPGKRNQLQQMVKNDQNDDQTKSLVSMTVNKILPGVSSAGQISLPEDNAFIKAGKNDAVDTNVSGMEKKILVNINEMRSFHSHNTDSKKELTTSSPTQSAIVLNASSSNSDISRDPSNLSSTLKKTLPTTKKQDPSLFLRNNGRQSTSEIDFQPAIVESGLEIDCTKQDVKDYKIAGLLKTKYIKNNFLLPRINASAQNLCENVMSVDQNQIHPIPGKSKQLQQMVKNDQNDDQTESLASMKVNKMLPSVSSAGQISLPEDGTFIKAGKNDAVDTSNITGMEEKILVNINEMRNMHHHNTDSEEELTTPSPRQSAIVLNASSCTNDASRDPSNLSSTLKKRMPTTKFNMLQSPDKCIEVSKTEPASSITSKTISFESKNLNVSLGFSEDVVKIQQKKRDDLDELPLRDTDMTLPLHASYLSTINITSSNQVEQELITSHDHENLPLEKKKVHFGSLECVQSFNTADRTESLDGEYLHSTKSKKNNDSHLELRKIPMIFDNTLVCDMTPTPTVKYPSAPICPSHNITSKRVKECFVQDKTPNDSRPRCSIFYNTNDFCMTPQDKQLFDERLMRWDPYCCVVEDLTQHGNVTNRIKNPPRWNMKNAPKQMSVVNFKIDQKYTDALRSKKLKIVVRMLPLHSSKSNNNCDEDFMRADTHIWPKGTFIEVNSRGVCNLKQRKMQQQDNLKWKGLCEPMDISNFIITNKHAKCHKIKVLSKDCNVYAIQVALVKYVCPEHIFDNVSIPSWSHEQSLHHAKKYMTSKVVVIEDDESLSADKCHDLFCSGMSLMLQLTCPLSLSPIRVPVKGLNCKHVQCFDLVSFLQTNSYVSGVRWKCPVCEDFISCFDLVKCSLFEEILNSNSKNILEGLDRFKLCADGSWDMLTGKKRGVSEEAPEDFYNFNNVQDMLL